MRQQRGSNVLEKLNRHQQEAVLETSSNLLIIAGAGSGKTKTLTHKVAYIIEQGLAQPRQIMALTFTNKAANEMKERIEKLIGKSIDELYIGTFHAIALRILRNEGFKYTVYDTKDQEALIKEILTRLNIDRKLYPPKMFISRISEHKLNLIKPDDISPNNPVDSLVKRVYTAYEEALAKASAVDFDNIILKAIELLENNQHIREKYANRFKYIFIDEYQDTNYPQYVFVKLLYNGNNRVCAVGDEDQSIYGFRGADVTKILNFSKDYDNCRIVKLLENYRSTQEILDVANRVISRNTLRHDKELYSSKTGGLVEIKEYESPRHEAQSIAMRIEELIEDGVKPSDIAVLYRTNYQSRIIEEELVKHGIPYRIVGSNRFFERKEVKDIVAYLKLALNPYDNISFLRAIQSHPRGAGKKLIERITAAAEGESLMERSRKLIKEKQITKKQEKVLSEFLEIFEGINGDTPAGEAIEMVFEKSGYKKYLEESKENGRIDNIMELNNAAAGMSLEEFVESVSLYDYSNDIDASSAVNLMTIHASKGLEFHSVFVVGVEEGLFPNANLKESQLEIEEERRLFYVAITRAKRNVFISYATTRMRSGEWVSVRPSRFIQELKTDRARVSFSRGDMVNHAIYGRGVVVAVEKLEDTEMLTVNFYKSGIKRVLAKDRSLESI